MQIARLLRFAVAFGLSGLAGLVASVAAPIQEPSPVAGEPTAKELVALEKTVRDMRQIGSALGRWSADHAAATSAAERQRLVEQARATKAEWTRPRVGFYLWREGPLRSLSATEVSRMLRPSAEVSYLRKLPTKDRWGRRFEWLGSPENLFGTERFALRSAGPNGEFEGPEYPLGAWEDGGEGATDDIVWADGAFVVWPRAADAEVAIR